MAEENKYSLTVKYNRHGILSANRRFNSSADIITWVFRSSDDTYREFDASKSNFIDILDDLSLEGYELICRTEDDDYIFRTKGEIEDTLIFSNENSLDDFLDWQNEKNG